jgi:nucleotide-binding universal stress UspA family protein
MMGGFPSGKHSSHNTIINSGERNPMTTDTWSTPRESTITSIFHPTDFSKGPDIAFAHALKLAWATNSRLTLFHVNQNLDELNWYDFPSVRATLEQWRRLEKEHKSPHINHSKIEVEKILGRGKDPSTAILKYLERHPADLIVLATHQLGGYPFFPSVAEPVARKSGSMTLFIPQSTKGFVSVEDGTCKLEKILIPVDGDPPPRVAVQAAAALANAVNGENVSFVAVHIGDDQTMPSIHPPPQSKGTWTHTVRHGNVVEEILQVAQEEQPNLIVMPTQGHNGFLDALRGSTTERVIREAHCPILAVPTD